MGNLPIELLIKIISYVNGITKEVTDLWRVVHHDDPANATLTNEQIFARLADKGDRGGQKWRDYIRDNP